MIDAVKSVLSQYVGFSGRARRSEYWYWFLATILASVVASIIEPLIGLGGGGSGPISGLLSLAIFLPGLAVTFRRLHDTGRSGWWVGGFYLGMVVIGIVAGVLAFGAATSGVADDSGMALFGVGMIVFFLFVIIYAIAMLVFVCQDSQPGPNRFGPNPKNEGNFDVFG